MLSFSFVCLKYAKNSHRHRSPSMTLNAKKNDISKIQMLKSRETHDHQQLCSHITLAKHWHLCSEFNHDPLILFSVNSITTACVLSNEYAHSFIRPLLYLWMEVNSSTILFALSVNPITFPFFFFHCGLVNPITTF